MKNNPKIKIKQFKCRRYLVPSLTLILMLPLLTSCSDFINEKSEKEKTPNTGTHQPTPETPKEPKPGGGPQTPKTPETPKPTPQGETEEQRNWRLCETERMWAFSAKLIDANELRLYQSRNFAPAFNRPGERQSGIEGWYICARALEMNGFIPHRLSDLRAISFEHRSMITTTENIHSNPVAISPLNDTYEDPDQRNNRLCQAERRTALFGRAISINQHLVFRQRNFAPVYHDPGDRDLGIESWHPCRESLVINGFIGYWD